MMGRPHCGERTMPGPSHMSWDDLPGWTFEVEEVSVGVGRVRGVDRAGRSVQITGSDLEQLLEHCRRTAIRIKDDVPGRPHGGRGSD